MSEKTCKYKHDGEWCWAQKGAPRCYHDAGLKECEDDKPVYVPTVITNADRIRSMSDEELAHKITAWSEVNDYEEDDYDPCVLAWLKMPYTEESK